MSDDALELKGNWAYPTTVRFGVGRIAELAKVCERVGIARPLIVTDPGLAELAMIKQALADLIAAGLEAALFSDIRSNPVSANVADGVRAFRYGSHDGVIAWGGGSALDAGKAIALMAGQSVSIWEFTERGGASTQSGAGVIAPVIAVPTTAGTGSEVGRASVIADEETHTKRVVFHAAMMPKAVIADPALTVGLPADITAATGMDALAHSLEAYSAPGYHPMADGIALEGMRLIKEWLAVAVEDGANLAARSHMMAAASMGATAFQKGLGAIHSLSHPVGGVYDTHHGLTNAVFMPYVLAFNRPAIEQRMVRLAAYLGLAEASFEAVMDWVLALRKDFHIPHTAAELGVEAARLDELSEMAARDPTAPTNPVPAGVAEMRAMYEAAMAGEIG